MIWHDAESGLSLLPVYTDSGIDPMHVEIRIRGESTILSLKKLSEMGLSVVDCMQSLRKNSKTQQCN